MLLGPVAGKRSLASGAIKPAGEPGTSPAVPSNPKSHANILNSLFGHWYVKAASHSEIQMLPPSISSGPSDLQASARRIPTCVHKVAVASLFVVDTIFSARLHRIVDNWAIQPLLLSTFLIVVLFYTGLIWIERAVLPLLLTMIGAGLFVFAVINFSLISGFPISLTTAFQFVPIMTFGVFFIMSRYNLGDYAMRVLLICATTYTVLYVLLGAFYVMNFLPQALLQPLLSVDAERGERLYCHSTMSAFAWFYWLHNFRLERNAMAAILSGLCFLAIVLTLSRVFIMCVSLITLLYMVRAPAPMIRYISLCILGGTSATFLYGFANLSYNPFAALSGDSSGGARAISYDLARSFLLENPLLGVGVNATDYEMNFVTGNAYFFPSDLGSLGIWFNFGLLGFFLFMVVAYQACKPILTIASRYSLALFLTGSMLAMNGCISPNLVVGSGAIYGAVLIGFRLNQVAA